MSVHSKPQWSGGAPGWVLSRQRGWASPTAAQSVSASHRGKQKPRVPSTKVSVETDVTRDPHAIYGMVGRTFAHGDPRPGSFALSQTKVISARLRAVIDPRDGSAPRVLSFDLSEKLCSLKYEGADLLLRRMLVDSGIDLTGAHADAGDESSRQIA